MVINEVIKSRRKERGWTQQELAEKLNLSRSTISSWETGRTYPDLEMIINLSDLFEITLDELLKGDRAVVKNIAKDSNRKKIYKAATVVTSIILLLVVGVVLANVFKFKEITADDIKSAERIGNEVHIQLNKTPFYSYSGYMAGASGSEIEIEIIKVFEWIPSDDLQEAIIDLTSFDPSESDSIVIVNDEEAIYRVE